ncbi:Aste57867_9189 [Aphanomyces stellatus]|uniref:Aste57867_9189 protein n=1 Tax=Aphanomyces stellatus TaxID=120398 RepID=A0A485KML4_9STRA|nr:hypothetical protein As57867_009153 [Aphanomyces stellatus]VFT86072.1 Aste57867_9189 [Aphanomyces stellatus]
MELRSTTTTKRPPFGGAPHAGRPTRQGSAPPFADAASSAAASGDSSSLFYRDLNFFESSSYDDTQPHVQPHDTDPDARMYPPPYYDDAHTEVFGHHRRKSSIEMFLSRSPSQHLGSDFFKLSLDEPSAFSLDKPLSASSSNPRPSPMHLQSHHARPHHAHPQGARYGGNQYDDSTVVDSSSWYHDAAVSSARSDDGVGGGYHRVQHPRGSSSRTASMQQSWHHAMPPPLPAATNPAAYGMMRSTTRRFPALLSPDKPSSSSLGLKQCKFFAQGHCRMGNKCKFAHQVPGGGPGSSASSYDDEFNSFVFRPEMTSSVQSPSGLSIDSASSLFGATLTIDDIQGRVYAMSKDQNGCRLLQEQLDFVDRSDLCDLIYTESLPHLVDMMVDPFGNYLFQKLLERVTDAQRLVVVQHVAFHLVAAALNLHGTRSVQKVVEICASSSQPALVQLIVDALKEDAVRLCIDSNGNHVIQRALQYMPSEYNQFVFDAVCAECTVVGTHRHGCCVLQRCVDAANVVQKAEVIAQVEAHAMKLMQDPYGNYVVQYVLDACSAADALGVMQKCVTHVFELSIQKFSSNVIEKCLELAPDGLRQTFVREIIACPRMYRMLQDQYANYVVQRALSVASEENCLALVAAIRPHLASMKNTQGGRRIQARILKRFPHLDVGWDPDYMGEHPSPAGPRPMTNNQHGSYGRVA